MDNGVIEQTANAGTAEATEKTGTEGSNGSGTVALGNSQGQESNAGGSQEFSEGGKGQGTDQGQRRFKSKAETIYELRQQSRDRETYWNNEVGTLKKQLAEIQKLFEPGQKQDSSRTLWDDPEGLMTNIHQRNLSKFKDELLTELRQTQDEREQKASLRQEASEAAKFIRSYKGMTDDDVHDIRELLVSDPVAQRLAESPMEQAEYVLYKWEKSRGVTDKTGLKNKAMGVTGAPVSNGGPKVWTESEMESAMRNLGNPKDWTPETKKKFTDMESEFMRAYAEKRVKK